MEDQTLQEDNLQEKIKLGRKLYLRKWREKNKDRYLKNMDNFWLRQYNKLTKDSENKV
jgi:hypothetical protein